MGQNKGGYKEKFLRAVALFEACKALLIEEKLATVPDPPDLLAKIGPRNDHCGDRARLAECGCVKDGVGRVCKKHFGASVEQAALCNFCRVPVLEHRAHEASELGAQLQGEIIHLANEEESHE